MRELARRHGLTSLIAPVRPSWKERYPLVPMERYAAWRCADGLLFNPWMRVLERLGATILKSEPRSFRITGTVAEWEEWTQIAFPESGDHWFPGGLATVATTAKPTAASTGNRTCGCTTPSGPHGLPTPFCPSPATRPSGQALF
jgi:hypothetical protein